MRLREIPLTAWIGILGILFAFFCAVFASLIAPFGDCLLYTSDAADE